MPTIAGTFGGPSDIKPEETPKHIAALQALDDARSDQIRQRALAIVKDPETAKVRLAQIHNLSVNWLVLMRNRNFRPGIPVGASDHVFTTNICRRSIFPTSTLLTQMDKA